MRESNMYRRMIFEVYCALMLVLLFLQRSPHLGVGADYAETLRANLNLIPGVTIQRFMRVWDTPVYHRAAIVNLIGNVTDKAAFLRYITPFGYCDGASITAERRLDGVKLAIGGALTLAGAVTAFLRYRRKDLK